VTVHFSSTSLVQSFLHNYMLFIINFLFLSSSSSSSSSSLPSLLLSFVVQILNPSYSNTSAATVPFLLALPLVLMDSHRFYSFLTDVCFHTTVQKALTSDSSSFFPSSFLPLHCCCGASSHWVLFGGTSFFIFFLLVEIPFCLLFFIFLIFEGELLSFHLHCCCGRFLSPANFFS
jgi:hypothetical protein